MLKKSLISGFSVAFTPLLAFDDRLSGTVCYTGLLK